MASAADDTVEDVLKRVAEKFKGDEGAATFAQCTEHVLELLRKDEARQTTLEALVGLQDQLHVARRLGNYVQEANMVEAITGSFRTDDHFGLKSMAPVPQQERSLEMTEMIKQMMTANAAAAPYEFLNTCDQEDMTVNIKVPPSTTMKDVIVKLTAKTIRVEVKGHEMQPCVIDGSFYKPVDTSGCDYHFEDSGKQRLLVLDLSDRIT